MTNNDFDKALQKKISEESIPFDESQWKRLENRLNDKNKGRAFFAIFPATKLYFGAAASVAAIVISIWYFSLENKNPIDTPITYETIIISPNTIANSTDSSNVSSTESFTNSKEEVRSHEVLARKDIVDVNEPTKDAINNKEVSIIIKDDYNIIAQKPVFKKLDEEVSQFNYYNDQPSNSRKKGLSVSLNGGLTFMNADNNIVAGISIRSSIRTNVYIETTIGVVNGNHNIPHKRQIVTKTEPIYISSDTGNVLVTPASTSVTTWYEQQKHNLPYLQLSPALTIQLHKKIFTTLGIDVQKVLISKQALNDLNDKLAVESEKIQEYDPGLIFKVNTSLTDRFGIGLSYRGSAVSIIDPNTNYINRDYMLLNLNYKLVK